MGNCTKAQKEILKAVKELNSAYCKIEELRIALKNQSRPNTINNQMRKLFHMCQERSFAEDYTKSMSIEDYYVTFQMKKLKEKCKTCGAVK